MGSSVAVGRLWSNLRQICIFGLVGGSGTVVNLAVSVVVAKAAWWLAGLSVDDAALNLFGTAFHLRWYHIFVTISFVVANTWNYQLNRVWTFRDVDKVSWARGFFPFLLTGIGAFFISQIVMTLLMNPVSPVGLPADIFDDSTGLRTKFYWANAISILVAMPINFVINKLWTFRTKPLAPQVIEETTPR